MRILDSWDIAFMSIAFAISERSKDESTQVGAVLVGKHNIVLSMGFNGPPRQLIDDLIPWNVRPDKYDYIIHAEENALLFALGSHGSFPLIESKMYCTHMPCPGCVLRMIRADVSECIYPLNSPDYPLRKILDNPNLIIEKQKFPKLSIRQINYERNSNE